MRIGSVLSYNMKIVLSLLHDSQTSLHGSRTINPGVRDEVMMMSILRIHFRSKNIMVLSTFNGVTWLSIPQPDTYYWVTTYLCSVSYRTTYFGSHLCSSCFFFLPISKNCFYLLYILYLLLFTTSTYSIFFLGGTEKKKVRNGMRETKKTTVFSFKKIQINK